MDDQFGSLNEAERSRLLAAASKAVLLRTSTESGLNLYDHLSQLLMKVLDEQPFNAVDLLEDMSLDLKRISARGASGFMRDLPETSAAELLAEQQRHLFAQPENVDLDAEMVEAVYPNVNENSFYLEQGGVGLSKEETQKIFLALKQLVESQNLINCRLWGKILGTESNYIVAEMEHGGWDEEQNAEEEQKKAEVKEEVKAEVKAEVKGEEEEEEEEEEQGKKEVDPLPQSTYKPPPEVPVEPLGTGVNKCVYYVCTEPGLPWTTLPQVTPAQINVARQIRKFFTGRLDAPVVSYPPFPGNEADYLRAQIARISASTHVSPKGFYMAVQEEGEDEEEEVTQDMHEVNPDFEGMPAQEIAGSLSNWIHHRQHILQQGRCSWVNLAAKQNDDSYEDADAEEDEEEDEEQNEPEPEVGPPLLTPVSEDAEVFNTSPWTSMLSSTLIPQHAVAVLRSNVWPGASAYAFGKKFENIYIGWGQKYTGAGFSPAVPPPPQTEYPSGPEMIEALDPTVEEEQQMKAALVEKEDAEDEMDDMEGSEEGEESDDDE